MDRNGGGDLPTMQSSQKFFEEAAMEIDSENIQCKPSLTAVTKQNEEEIMRIIMQFLEDKGYE